MKKLVFMFVAFAAVSFASCGNKTSEAEAANDSDSAAVVVDSNATDSNAVDSNAVDSNAAATDSANAPA